MDLKHRNTQTLLASIVRKPTMAGVLVLLVLIGLSWWQSQQQPNGSPALPTNEILGTELDVRENNNLVADGLYLVEKVVDGDTVHVKTGLGKEVVRLIGIDTPETVAPNRDPECFGKQAATKASELLASKQVRLETDVTKGNRDKYGRLLRYVFVQADSSTEELNVNLYLVRQGFAKENSYGVHHKLEVEFKNAQQQAQAEKLGLWAEDICNK